MTTLKEAAQQALEALKVMAEGAEEECGEEHCPDCEAWRPVWVSITALESALKQADPPSSLWRYDYADPFPRE